MPDGSHHLADRLLAREAVVLDRYRQRLLEQPSPLATEEDLWNQLTTQASGVLSACAESLRTDSAQAAGDRPPGVVDMATRRAGRGIQPRHSVRASVVLFEVVLSELADLVADTTDAHRATDAVALTLNRELGVRLEAGAVGYDAFLLNQVREVVDADRRELAREIHDRLGNTISLASRLLELAEQNQAATGTGDLPEQVGTAQGVLAEALAELRTLITGLRRSRAEGALQAALLAYVASVRMAKPDVSIAVNGVESWAPATALDEVFMILRESLRNVVAHAAATQVTVKVDVAPHELRAAVEDDGVGFDLESVLRGNSTGHGLTAMRERAQALAGRLHVSSAARRGTRVTLWIPLQGFE